VKFGIDLVDHFTEMVLIIGEVIVICLNDEDLSKVIGFHPGLIPFIQPLQVVNSDRAFIFTAPFLNLVNKGRNGSPEI